MTVIWTDAITWTVAGQVVALNDDFSLGPLTGAPSQVWTLEQGTAIQYLTVASQPGNAVNWADLAMGAVWDNASSPNNTWYQQPVTAGGATYVPGFFLSGSSGSPAMLQPNAAGTAAVMGPIAGMSLVTPPAYTPPQSSLQSVTVGMFNPQNPNAADPTKQTGSCEYVWSQLQKPTTAAMSGAVVFMPLAVGLTGNWGGDTYVWYAPGDIQSSDTTVRAWMISVGLTYPGGPTLTAAAAAGVALYDASAPMDNDWAGAIFSARFRQNEPNLSNGGTWVGASNTTQYSDVLYVRLGWEMSGDWYLWGRGASDFNTAFGPAFARAAEIARDVCSQPDKNGKTTQCIVVFNPNWDYASVGVSLDTIWPGDANVDMVALDAYDQPQFQGGVTGSTPNLTAAQRFAQYQLPALQAIDAYAHAHNKTVGVCEFGAGDSTQFSSDNPDFINGMANWAKSAVSPLGIFGYWNGQTGSGYNSYLPLYPNQQAAYIANFGV